MKKILVPAALAAVVGIGMAQMPKSAQHLNKLRYAEQAIAQLYVDTVNEEKLVEDAIKGMLEQLDPHSAYTNAKETKEQNEPLEGKFSGIGITYNLVKDTVYVISTVPNGPSAKVGLLPGDRILSANDTAISGVKITQRGVVNYLRGPKGTQVNLKTLRMSGNKTDTIFFNITRDDIPIYSVDASYMVTPETGYIKLNKFGAETAKEFREALKKLQKKGMQNLILDLTANGGGYLNSSVELLGELLPEDYLAVYTEGTNSHRQNLYVKPSGKEPMFDTGRLVVMTDEYSASAAEITSGAIQDYDRGVIVGRRTFGKGLVQRPIPFPDGSMMRLTVAHYYTPTGRDIQRPYKKGDAEAYRKDLTNRFNHGELMHPDSIKYDEAKATHTMKSGRKIYGGGGISPDKFVPLDTMPNTKYLRDLSAKNVLLPYVVDYVDQNRKLLKKQYKDDDKFIAGFTVTEAMLADVVKRGEEAGVTFNQEEYDRSKGILATMIKGLIGRDVYESQTYDKVYNPMDPIFVEALRIIESDEYDNILRGN
ncbi:MAG: S41 family peptidase [Prevotella sp.]|nr:S41 family peptidase [Prevotella sp.]MCM1075433.1 S41 family peptidase [Ruminococcus sp.]